MSDQLWIYGHIGSQPVRSVVIFAKLSMIPYEFKSINLANGEQYTEEFIRINPFKEIPAIVHGSYSLWQSAAIVTYLSEAFDTDNQWYPKDLKIRGRINAYLHWHHENTREIVATYVRDKYIFPRFFGAPQISESRESELYKNLCEYFNVLKNILSNTGFIAQTPTATIADVFAYSEIAQSWFLDFDLSDFPEVNSWFKKIGENEVVKEVHDILKEIITSFR